MNIDIEKPNFKQLILLNMQQLTNFPYIEKDFDAITDYQLLCKVVEYLNDVIKNQNTTNETVLALYNAFITLKDYVDNYFTNLDVQDEINNKLDEMAEDGSLTALIDNIFTDIKEDISNIENKVNSVASGSPAGVYETVANLTAADPDHSRIYLVTNNGNWYYYDDSSSDWASGGVYQSIELIEDSIYPYYETAFIKEGMIPKTGWIQNKTIQSSNGAIINFNGCYHPEYFPVVAGEQYCFITNKLVNGEAMRVAWYDDSNTYISDNSVAFGAGVNQVVTAPEDAAYCRFACYTENFAIYPDNFNQLIKLSDLTKLIDYTKSTYLDLKYNIVNNENVYLQDRIMYYPFTAANTSFITGFKIENKYTLSYDNIISSPLYPFNPIYIDNPQIGDIIKTKVDNMDHISGIGLYPLTSQSVNTNFTYNSETDTYDLTLTQSIIDNYFVDGKARICYRLNKNITTNTHVIYKATININNEFNNFNDLIKALENKNQSESYKAMFFGDSITQLTGNRSWITYFNNIISLSNIDNIAVIGATMHDKANTVLDGNPVFNGADNNENNVLCNQVQKVINNVVNYQVPDIIFIAIGTNGGITTSSTDAYNQYYNNDGTAKDLSTVNRKTDAGAFRWVNEKLHELYSNAMIVWCTPIQAANTTRNVIDIIKWGDNLKLLCGFGSNYCIDTEKCGINGINETTGSNGEDLLDGLHPNSHGAKKIGTFNACEFKKFLDKIKQY